MYTCARIRFVRFFILSALCCVLYISCANTTPELLSSNGTVVFDYRDDTSVPEIRLSVFAEAGSDVRRAARIRVVSRADEYEWTTDDLKLIGSDNRQWAGYTNFAVPESKKIPQGQYDLYYTDAEEHTVQAVFSVTYPEKLVESKSADVKNILGASAKEMVAVYMSDGTLIYYNVRKPEWTDDNAVWNDMKLASKMRICWTSADDSVVCLMPSEERPSSDSKK
jgi:hypothetical protein